MAKQLTKLADLTPDPHNANLGTERGRALLEHSLRSYGAGRSVLADKHGTLIAGNKTIEAAAELGFTIRVVETDGTDVVVVQRKDLDLETDPRARELAYVDNRAAELDLDWNIEQLRADTDAGLASAGAGFSAEELARLLDQTTGRIVPLDHERATRRRVSAGDVWRLGTHRLIVGQFASECETVLSAWEAYTGQEATLDPPMP